MRLWTLSALIFWDLVVEHLRRDRHRGRKYLKVCKGGCKVLVDRECHDNLTAIYAYPVDGRTVRATCQVHTTTHGTAGSHELLLGTAGSIRTSENPRWSAIFREPSAVRWDEWVRKGYLAKAAPAVEPVEEPPDDQAAPSPVVAAETGELERYEMPAMSDQSSFQYHLENFLDAARGNRKLNCPPETALAAEAAALRAIEAVETEQLVTI